jgi:hypothetical protein
MLTIWGAKEQTFCNGVTRRGFLQVGALGCAGFTLADFLRLRAQAAPGGQQTPRGKSVIMVLLIGGPSHIDMYDLKPDAPPDIRGEFKPIATRTPGLQICELMPRQAQISDKLAIIRNMTFSGDDHSGEELTTGLRADGRLTRQLTRPAHGSIVSFLKGRPSKVPAYVVLSPPLVPGNPEFPDEFAPLYVGPGHRAFVPSGAAYDDLRLATGMTSERLGERQQLLRAFDSLRRDLDAKGELAGMDRFRAQAFELITSDATRNALDITREPEPIRAKYGITDRAHRSAAYWLQARRLVESGVPVVNFVCQAGAGWDTHDNQFPAQRKSLLPNLDRSVSALVSDLHDRGLDKDVAVVVWGEMGRTPRINDKAGRDHWKDAGFALMAGGGWQTGQVIGKTDARATAPVVAPYTPQNVLATLYRHLGIDPTKTLVDYSGRPHPLLEQSTPIKELW